MAVHDVNPTELILRTAQELKKDSTLKAPAWAPFVKTGHSRERQPTQPDWWQIRAASILRKILILGPVGTQKLRRKYGGRKNMGMAPERFHIAGGSIIREILQQLEKAGLAKQATKGAHKGRIITPKGQQLIESIAVQIAKEQGLTFAKKSDAVQTQAASEEKKPKAPRKKAAPRKKKAEPAPTESTETPAAPESAPAIE
ncbi:30S ribosomal protein S19e [Candidatus Woesearchaeota archaeon]|nr:MAG: 30S ribosomal protein S19e [Candidatus Woesearchaeota archaeon]